MKKLISALILSILLFHTIEAQQQYAEVMKDFSDRSVQFFKGEIYEVLRVEMLMNPITKKTYERKIFQISGIEYSSINDMTILPASAIPQNKAMQKDNFIKLMDNGWLHVDVYSIATGRDTIWLANTTDKLQKILNNTVIDLNPDIVKFGNEFRLIIPNTLTVWYNKSELKHYIKPQTATQENKENANVSKAESDEKHRTVWKILICAAIGLGLIIFAVLRILGKIVLFEKEPIKVLYTATGYKSLSEFAEDNGIILDDLLKMNKKVIDKKYKWVDEVEKENMQNKLRGQYLIVGHKAIDDEKSQTSVPETKEYHFTETKENHFPEKIVQSPDNIQKETNISEQLQQMQKTIIHEIKQIGIADKNSKDIIKLKKANRQLVDENTQLKETYAEKDSKIHQLENENSDFVKQIQEIQSENELLSSQIEIVGDRVIFVDYLKRYAGNVYSYLELCQRVSTEAYNTYNQINRQKQSFSASLLLLNFQIAVNSIPIGKWMQIVQDIKDTEITTNKELIQSLVRIKNDKERLKEFQRLIHTEVFSKYSSNILILAEAFKNLSRFQVIPEHVFSEIKSSFEKNVVEIINKSKAVGLDMKYLPLFEDFENRSDQIESVDRAKSLAYRNVIGLGKNVIAEIISYGMKTDFEDSKTLIIST